MKGFKLIGIFLTLFVGLSGISVGNDLTIFDNRSSWEIAGGGTPAITENFNSINTETPLPIDLGVFSFSTTGPDSIIDAAPFIDPPDGVPGDLVVDGTTYFRAAINNQNISNEVITITFDVPVFSWGVDLNPHSGDLGDKVDIVADSGENGIWILPLTDRTEFRGLIANDAFTSLTFSFNPTSVGNWAEAGWDNVAAHSAPVPEPTTPGNIAMPWIPLLLDK